MDEYEFETSRYDYEYHIQHYLHYKLYSYFILFIKLITSLIGLTDRLVSRDAGAKRLEESWGGAAEKQTGRLEDGTGAQALA